jgi:phosphatidylserine/phosphatidylglycerophosphate/cardiolipin synthase-like enzyme
MGPEARAKWPALATLIRDAKAAAKGRTLDADAVAKARYQGQASAREVRADRVALIQTLEALRVLERSARSRGVDPALPHALQMQLVTRINHWQRVDAERRERFPRQLSPAPELSYAEAFLSLRSRHEAPYALVGPTIELLVTLAGELREQGSREEGPFSTASFGRTLAQAGLAEVYEVEGLSGGQRYRGRATLEETAQGLVLVSQRAGQPVLRAVLERADEGWRWSASFRESPGAAGRLAGGEPQERRTQAELRPGKPGTLRLRWRTLDAEGKVLARGTEDLRRVTSPQGFEAQARMSSLMAKIVAACRPVTGRGTVPAGLLVSTAKRVHPAFIEGPAIFTEQARMIRGAKREVLLQVFVWEVGSEASKLVEGALRDLAKARAGAKHPVRVRVVLNGHDWFKGAYEQVEARLLGLGLDKRVVDLRVARHGHKLVGALHSKALVVDGEQVLVTGANLERVHDAGSPWFDTGYRLDGALGASARAEFGHLWKKSTGERLPPLEDTTSAGEIVVLFATRRANGNPFSNRMDNPFGQAYLSAIRGARKVVKIHTPNLNDDALKRAIVDAVVTNRVQVQIVVSKRFNEVSESIPGWGGPNRKNVIALFREVRRRGGADAVARLKFRWYAAPEGAVEGNGPRASHAKYASFDDQVAIVGSGNMDTQSQNHSREFNLVVDDPRAVRAWDRKVFDPSFGRAVRIRPVFE